MILLLLKPLQNLIWGRGFEKKLDGLGQIITRLFNRFALTTARATASGPPLPV
jgi:hypothetical protein